MVRNLPLKSLFKNKQTKIPPQKKPKQTKTPKNQTQNQPSKEEKKNPTTSCAGTISGFTPKLRSKRFE